MGANGLQRGDVRQLSGHGAACAASLWFAMHHFTALPSVEGADPSQSADHVIAIKGWTRAVLKLEEDAVVTVTELACSDPGCPLLETTIAVFENDRTRVWKLTRPRMAVTKGMVLQTLQSPPASKP